MAVVYLVRHGQASFGAADYDVLSELGARQSEVLGAELRRRAIDPTLVRTGGMRRQRDTATHTLRAAGIDIPPTVDVRFDEYDHTDLLARYGDPHALTQQTLGRALGAWIADGSRSPCAEHWPEFQKRVRAAVDDVLHECGSGGSAVVFTSGGVISALCAVLVDAPAASFQALNRVTVNAAITTVASGRSGTNLLAFNDHAHLTGEHADLRSYR